MLADGFRSAGVSPAFLRWSNVPQTCRRDAGATKTIAFAIYIACRNTHDSGAYAKNIFLNKYFSARSSISIPSLRNFFLTSPAFARKTTVASLLLARAGLERRAKDEAFAAPRGDWFTERMREGQTGNAGPETGPRKRFQAGRPDAIEAPRFVFLDRGKFPSRAGITRRKVQAAYREREIS